ncbi:MAG: MmcQ/YjbR family DNA-binding protein [Bacteroidetes Order II. Incertae sedis bacterium]|nr:MmcQ/YjbR family DNA-binding protein [Bacteroidetes Order II. bacterium]
MNLFATLYDYLVQKNGAIETFPFGENVLVMKVKGKIFALLPLDETPTRINLKCDPSRAVELRTQYDAIMPGYHMSKQHWNTLTVDGRLPLSLVLELIDHSYELVVASLKKTDRLALEST